MSSLFISFLGSFYPIAVRTKTLVSLQQIWQAQIQQHFIKPRSTRVLPCSFSSINFLISPTINVIYLKTSPIHTPFRAIIIHPATLRIGTLTAQTSHHICMQKSRGTARMPASTRFTNRVPTIAGIAGAMKIIF
jgi:hypothetical protein